MSQPQTRDHTRRVLDGKYQLEGVIGEGASGVVYRARHLALQIDVAVKLLNEVSLDDPRAHTRFSREARLTAGISHPNVVSVRDFGRDERGRPYIVMELVLAETLRSLLHRQPSLNARAACAICHQILAGLAAAHACGVIHRDLKPRNVLLVPQPHASPLVKIVDFGVAKLLADEQSQLTSVGSLIGTLGYCAPEQILGDPQDERADLYAVGVILYRMLTARLPFSGKTPHQVQQQILDGEFLPPSRLQPDLPAGLEAVVLHAMARSSEDRPGSARQFMEEMLQAMPDPAISISGLIDAPNRPTPDATEDTARDASAGPRRAAGRPLYRLWLPLLLGLGLLAGLMYYAAFGDRPQQPGPNPAASHTPGGSADTPIIFSIVQWVSAREQRSELQPAMDYLAKRLGRPVKLRVTDHFRNIEEDIRRGTVHMAEFSSCDYVRAYRDGLRLKNIVTHVTNAGKTFKGLILVRENSPYQKLSDLRGQRFCFVNKRSCSGYVYVRIEFRQAGIDPDRDLATPVFSRVHHESMRLLQRGVCEGAAVWDHAFYAAEKEGISKEHFRIIGSTAPILRDIYGAPPSVPDALADRIRDILLELRPGSDLARRVMGPNNRMVGFRSVGEQEFDDVRKLDRLVK